MWHWQHFGQLYWHQESVILGDLCDIHVLIQRGIWIPGARFMCVHQHDTFIAAHWLSFLKNILREHNLYGPYIESVEQGVTLGFFERLTIRQVAPKLYLPTLLTHLPATWKRVYYTGLDTKVFPALALRASAGTDLLARKYFYLPEYW